MESRTHPAALNPSPHVEGHVELDERLGEEHSPAEVGGDQDDDGDGE